MVIVGPEVSAMAAFIYCCCLPYAFYVFSKISFRYSSNQIILLFVSK